MGSIPSISDSGSLADDRTTRARIRDAAIECFARLGVASTTVRKVAEAAGVSAGLVIHHFGSMDGLRSACDEHVAATIRHFKQEALSAGPNLDILAALRSPDVGPMMGYLGQVLADDSAIVARLVDDLVDDAEGYIRQGVESGMLQPTTDARGRAVLLTIWGLGALVLHEHLERLLGVDLTDPDVLTDPSITAYVGPVYEIYSGGIFTDAFAARTQDALDGMASQHHDAAPQLTGDIEPPHSDTNEGAS
ncbi:MAG: TetR family transcriptional regulator [Proteobacteria bacterium]|nr:TetR family transcriptional regulator [Pseudomonadota bacterium]